MALAGKYKFLITAVVIIALAVLFYNFFIQVRQIEPGNIGVKSNIGSTDDTDMELVKGYVIFMPLLTDLQIYPTTIQTAAYDSLKVTTKDGVQFSVKPSVSYQLDEQKAGLFYKICRKPIDAISKTYLKEIVIKSFDEAANHFVSDSLFYNKHVFDSLATALLTQKASLIGLDMKNISSNLQIPAHISQIMMLRSQALQNAILAEDKRIQAEAEARLDFAAADGQRRKDSLNNSALTPLFIQKLFIEKWDGKLSPNSDTPKIYKDLNE